MGRVVIMVLVFAVIGVVMLVVVDLVEIGEVIPEVGGRADHSDDGSVVVVVVAFLEKRSK